MKENAVMLLLLLSTVLLHQARMRVCHHDAYARPEESPV